jgi:preprotein translocase subunit SecA
MAMTDEELGQDARIPQRLADGETLDDILPEAFAPCARPSWRVLGMKPFRVQLIGGVVLHQGRIAEMKTGEGKTLVAVLPAYLNALTGRACISSPSTTTWPSATASGWARCYRFLGLSVGLIVHDKTPDERREAYACDITYGTNNEMGFDYLRDNMAIYKEQMVQRGHAFAIVDEVDSILIDEARTPLIISGQGDGIHRPVRAGGRIRSGLKKIVVRHHRRKEEEDENLDADYVVDEKPAPPPSPPGIAKAEKFFGTWTTSPTRKRHPRPPHQSGHEGPRHHEARYRLRGQGRRGHHRRRVHRPLMLGRRYSEGLHQAIEAKEHVDVRSENKTLATITFQNYFRLYDKLSGMTGTALTEEEEFETIYSWTSSRYPPTSPIRLDHHDVVYKTEDGKYRAVIEQIIECHEKGQPVLVGTISIEKSELLSKMLKKRGIKHNVLNAKQHEKEAEIIAQAGKFGAVTIATNMAGRGTDIMLGGNADYLARNDLRKAGSPRSSSPRPPATPTPTTRRFSPPAQLYADKQAEHKARSPPRPTRSRPRAACSSRHRAPRIPPYRQPAARPFRPAGRPRREPLLHLHDRRHDAPVRRRAVMNMMETLDRGRGYAPSTTRCFPTPSSTPRRPSRAATSRPVRTCWNSTTS